MVEAARGKDGKIRQVPSCPYGAGRSNSDQDYYANGNKGPAVCVGAAGLPR